LLETCRKTDSRLCVRPGSGAVCAARGSRAKKKASSAIRDIASNPIMSRALKSVAEAGPVAQPLFHSAFVGTVLVGVVLAGLAAMVLRVQRVAVRNVSVMTRGFVIAGFMVSRGFAVMFGCGFMMIGSLMMMVGAFVCHGYVSCRK